MTPIKDGTTWDTQVYHDGLSAAMRRDPELAWTWHCQIATANMEGGYLKWKESNEAACRTMMNLFQVDTSPKFKELLKNRTPGTTNV